MKLLERFRRGFRLSGYVYDANKHNGWGNNIEWSDYDKRRIVGWLYRKPQVGDEIRFKMQSGKVARFAVKEVERAWGVHDMFFADVMDIGYVGEEPINKVIEASGSTEDEE